MAEKDETKPRVANRSSEDADGDLRPVRPATLGATPRTRRQLAEEVAEFRRNVRRKMEPTGK